MEKLYNQNTRPDMIAGLLYRREVCIVAHRYSLPDSKTPDRRSKDTDNIPRCHTLTLALPLLRNKTTRRKRNPQDNTRHSPKLDKAYSLILDRKHRALGGEEDYDSFLTGGFETHCR